MQTLKQVGWSIWLTICFLIVFSTGWSSHYYMTKHLVENKVVTSCQSDKNRTAWLAKKDGIYRCFLEYNDYPHRAKGYAIPDEPENNYSTPLEYIQRELRFDFQEERYSNP